MPKSATVKQQHNSRRRREGGGRQHGWGKHKLFSILMIIFGHNLNAFYGANRLLPGERLKGGNAKVILMKMDNEEAAEYTP